MTYSPSTPRRTAALVSLAAAGVLAFTSCSSSPSATPSTDTGAGSSGASDVCSGAANLNAAGSTAQANAMTLATSGFQAKCNAQVSYNGTGSGNGITSFIAKQVDFAGSDSALNKEKDEPSKAAEACGSEAWNLPMVTGPVAVAFNVKGVDKLTLDATTTAKIFSGAITTWNDDAIAKLNSGVTLPDEPINVFFRSDESGTTDNFTNYLGTAAPQVWKDPHGKSWTGKVGQGKNKTAGVSSAIKATEGGIGYVEWSYAITDQLKMAAIDTGSGAVELSAESAGKAVEAAEITGSGNDLSLKLDYATKAAGAYPIILVTYEVVCSKYSDPAKGAAVKSFLGYLSSSEYQDQLTQIGSAPLPAPILAKVETAVAAIA